MAQIGKPFGLAGEVTVRVLTDEPARRFVVGTRLAQADDSAAAWLVVDRARGGGERWVLGFDGVNDRDEAERLRGVTLFAEVTPDQRPEHPDEWYDHQLVGLAARSPSGEELGEVIAVDHLPAQDLLVVKTPAEVVVQVPFVAEIVTRVDHSGVTLDAPSGLFDDGGER